MSRSSARHTPLCVPVYTAAVPTVCTIAILFLGTYTLLVQHAL